MKTNTQQRKMGEIYALLSQDLGYLHGEREGGPNGAKRVFLRTAAAFLRRLGKDLKFAEMAVRSNPGGIAVSGELWIRGMCDDNHGVYFKISQDWSDFLPGLLYREIKSLQDYSCGPNQWIPPSVFLEMDYQRLCNTLLELKHEGAGTHAA